MTPEEIRHYILCRLLDASPPGCELSDADIERILKQAEQLSKWVIG